MLEHFFEAAFTITRLHMGPSGPYIPTKKKDTGTKKAKTDSEDHFFQLRLMTLDPGRLYCQNGVLNLFEAYENLLACPHQWVWR